ncbi:XrtA/PEP-CTERM system TPR-repeat protein PrsT [Neptunomonas qingdaonensis]|uniref:Putative PEP-CTERM system TPR-repeat lipoprotein n=1 Tax=Neptunomonas qingdaonensis TaxID=1045558 RepID=A0A1I2RJ19_9GAMM|nr:XrtA/PEP-CTERM system TPR-repeat protein PrsT [Neptunomonas qingdaonensis]SFG40083.1 putative PEP-CTERM system TPR-repeat lipoprotein [Neptunomonas qingdaonensis]
MSIFSRAGVLILTFSCLTPLAVADNRQDVGMYFEDANKLYYQDELPEAIIQLKNALQANPQHLPSLLLSGEIYLQQGDPKAAEYALRQALIYGADSSLVVLNLAKSYLQLGNYQRIISDLQVDGLSQPVQVDLLGYRAEAYTLLDQLPDARFSIDLALNKDARALLPRLANVILLIREGALDEALDNAQVVITDWPEDARSWNSHASVMHAQGDLASAIQSYQKALTIQPSHVDARVAKVGALIDLARLDEAADDLAFLKKEYPYEPRAAYFRGLLLSKAGDEEGARLEYVRCTEVIAVLSKDKVASDPQLLMSAALAHYALNQLESARNYLQLYLNKVPSDVGAHKLLADVLLKQGDPENAIKILNTARSLLQSDADLLTMLAAAYSQTGRHARATRLLEEAVSSGGSLFTKTQLAKSLLRSGDVERGMQALEKIHAQEPTQQTGFLLTVSYLKQKAFEKAEGTAHQLVGLDPDNVTYRNLFGIALFSQGKMEVAREQFNLILKQAPSFSAAQINIVKIDIAEQKLSQARTQMELLLVQYPENTSVMLEMSRLELASEKQDEALRWAEKAFALDSRSLEVVLYLTDLYVKLEKLDLAESVARTGVQNHADNLAVLSVLGQIQTLKNQPKAAQVTFKQMVKMAGFDAESLYKIANLQLRINEIADARYSLSKVLQAEPDYFPAEVLEVELSIKLGMLEGAEKSSRKLQKDYPGNPVGFQLLGDVYMARQLYKQADEQYLLGLSIRPASGLISSRYKALQAQNKPAESGRVLEDWLAVHPDDLKIKLAYSEYLIITQDYKQAAILLVQLLNRFPEDPLLLNNMAHVLYKLKRPEALNYAKGAYAKAAHIPQIADTLGWLLVESGNAEGGLKYLREANSRDSNSPEILYHLAVALKAIGRKKEAIIYLERALRAAEIFEERDKAVALKASLLKDKN